MTIYYRNDLNLICTMSDLGLHCFFGNTPIGTGQRKEEDKTA